MSEKSSKPSSEHRYRTLFLRTFYLSAFTFGGGFVIIPLMQRIFVEDLGWLDQDEMMDLAAIAQSSPGAVAVNGAMLLGRRVAGWPGMFIATLGTVLPPLIIISIITFMYEAFQTNPWVKAILTAMRAGVAAVIADVVINLGGDVVKSKNIVSILAMIFAFIATYKGVNVILVIFICGLIGGIQAFIKTKKQEKE